MSETINTYPINDPETLVPMDRKKFYEEQIAIFKETGKPTRAVDAIAILIFNSEGKILLQKRSYNKSHNAGLLDKSLGGHVQYGDTIDYTVMVETVQELQTPSIVLKNKDDFEMTYNLLKGYLSTIAVVKHGETKIYIIDNVIDGERIPFAKRVHMYFGVYDGRVQTADQEAKGVLWYSLKELEKELGQFPVSFTPDIHTFYNEYRKDMEAFVAYITARLRILFFIQTTPQVPKTPDTRQTHTAYVS